MELPARNKRSRLVRYILVPGAVLLGVVLAVVLLLMVLGPSSGKIDPKIVDVTCFYQVKVVAFEDTNSDGVQNPGEPGVAGVKVTLQHSLAQQNTPEQTSTDSSGLASLNADTYCPQRDTLTINVAPPAGYSATTPISFGPYPVPNLTAESMTQVAQKYPIPSVLYVGLR